MVVLREEEEHRFRLQETFTKFLRGCWWRKEITRLGVEEQKKDDVKGGEEGREDVVLWRGSQEWVATANFFATIQFHINWPLRHIFARFF